MPLGEDSCQLDCLPRIRLVGPSPMQTPFDCFSMVTQCTEFVTLPLLILNRHHVRYALESPFKAFQNLYQAHKNPFLRMNRFQMLIQMARD